MLVYCGSVSVLVDTVELQLTSVPQCSLSALHFHLILSVKIQLITNNKLKSYLLVNKLNSSRFSHRFFLSLEPTRGRRSQILEDLFKNNSYKVLKSIAEDKVVVE